MYYHGDYPRHCSPCFLVAKPGSTAMRLVVDHGEVSKKTHKKHDREYHQVSIEDQDGSVQT